MGPLLCEVRACFSKNDMGSSSFGPLNIKFRILEAQLASSLSKRNMCSPFVLGNQLQAQGKFRGLRV